VGRRGRTGPHGAHVAAPAPTWPAVMDARTGGVKNPMASLSAKALVAAEYLEQHKAGEWASQWEIAQQIGLPFDQAWPIIVELDTAGFIERQDGAGRARWRYVERQLGG